MILASSTRHLALVVCGAQSRVQWSLGKLVPFILNCLYVLFSNRACVYVWCPQWTPLVITIFIATINQEIHLYVINSDIESWDIRQGHPFKYFKPITSMWLKLLI